MALARRLDREGVRSTPEEPWRASKEPTVRVDLDNNEVAAVLHALRQREFTAFHASRRHEGTRGVLASTSLLASGARVHMALEEVRDGE